MSSINNSGNVGAPARDTLTTSTPDATLSSTARTQQLQTSSPRVAVDVAEVQRDVNLFLQRAGLERGPDGTMVVKDSASIGRTGEVKGLSAAEQIYGTGETQLKPPAPLRFDFTTELKRGAETFASNVDTAVNDAFRKPTGTRSTTATPLVIGKGAADASTLTSTAKDAVAATTSTPELSPEQFRAIAEMTADVLLAAFLKLNINDPNNNVETQTKLQEIMTLLRQKGIEDAKAQIKNAEELRKSAEAYAKQAQFISNIISVVMIILTLILAALTGGAAAVLVVAVCMAIGAVVGAASGGAQGALSGASLAGSIGSFGVTLAAQAAVQAAKTAAETAVKEAVKNAMTEVTKAVQKAVCEAIKTAATKGGALATDQVKQIAQQAASKAVEQAMSKIGTEMAQQISKQVTAEIGKSMIAQFGQVSEAALTEAIQQGMQQALQTAVQDAVQAGIKQGIEQAVTEATTTVAKEATQSAVSGLTESVIKEIATDATKQAIALSKESIDKAFNGIAQQAAKEVNQAMPSLAKAESALTPNQASAIRATAQAGGEVVKAGANKTATEKMLEAQQAEIQAKRMRLIAEMAQNQIQDQGEIIKMIMESKNNMVDAVIKMMNAMFASSQKLMSAGMAK